MNILGISSFFHDSAAALIVNGKIVAAAQEERFTRKKHDANFPNEAIKYCLKEANLKINDINLVAYYEKPLLKFERLLETYLAFAPKGFNSFIKAIPTWIKQKIWVHDIIRKELDYAGELIFVEHHQAHAASAFFPSPFESAAFITLDGVGEWTTTSYGTGRKNNINIDQEIRFPHSLGLLYSAFTYYTGFKVNSGEYKVMGLAPYGTPRFVNLILDNLIDLKSDGSFRLNMQYFNYCSGLKMTNRKFHDLFDGPPRKPEAQLTQREMDLAASIQVVCERAMLNIAKHVKETSGQKNLCLAGGVALNCVGNGKILAENIFEKIWIQPASGDAGGALGAALFGWYQYLGNTRNGLEVGDYMQASLLGPTFTNNEIENFLKEKDIIYERLTDQELLQRSAKILAEEKVIGWFQGRMEFGPRALGARSIIGDARSEKMQSVMNLKIKYRESFRPFAPLVLDHKKSEYFNLNSESPYMLIVAPVSETIRVSESEEQKQQFGIERLNHRRSTIPAVTHVDYSARVQTVDANRNPRLFKLLEEFENLTGCAVLVNTSFNVRGEPIVCTPDDALRCFLRTEMDYLILENIVIDKTKQTIDQKDLSWQSEFELD